MTQPLDIQIWSDIACPWCYIGKRRLEAALRELPDRESVKITWRSFELDPEAPATRPAEEKLVQRLASKYGASLAQAQAMMDNVTSTAAKDGLELRFDRARSGNTFDAHRLLHFAKQRGKGDAMKERLFRAYMTEGEAIGDRDVLVRLAGELGFDAAEVRAMLAGDAHAQDVRGDEIEAEAIGIRGVPLFVIDGKYGVSGAQPAETLLRVLQKARAEQKGAITTVADGEVCGPDGCA